MRVVDLPGLKADRDLAAVIALRDGRMSGIFTERDLMTKVVVARLDPATTPVFQVMTEDVTTVTVDDPVDVCLRRMGEGGFRHLPVVDNDGEPFAMLSQRDFVTVSVGDAMRWVGAA